METIYKRSMELLPQKLLPQKLFSSNTLVDKFPLISRSVLYEEIRWHTALNLIQKRYNLDPKKFSKALERLKADLVEPFGFRWVLHPKIHLIEALIISTLIEVNGCDELRIKRSGFIFRLLIHYSQEFVFVKGEELIDGSKLVSLLAKPINQELSQQLVQELAVKNIVLKDLNFTFRVFGRNFNLDSRKNAFVLYLLSSTILAAFLAPVALLLIYCVSVFVIFVLEPQNTTILATKQLTIGLALLSFLTGLAALMGMVFRRVSGGLLKRWR